MQSSPPSTPLSPSGLGTLPPAPRISCTQKLILDSLFETRQQWHHPGDRRLLAQLLHALLCPVQSACWLNSVPSKLPGHRSPACGPRQLLWVLSCEAWSLMCLLVLPGACWPQIKVISFADIALHLPSALCSVPSPILPGLELRPLPTMSPRSCSKNLPLFSSHSLHYMPGYMDTDARGTTSLRIMTHTGSNIIL